jgi:hypothetical protein
MPGVVQKRGNPPGSLGFVGLINGENKPVGRRSLTASLPAPVPDSQRDRLVHRPHGNDVASALSGGIWNSPRHAAAAAAVCLP